MFVRNKKMFWLKDSWKPHAALRLNLNSSGIDLDFDFFQQKKASKTRQQQKSESWKQNHRFLTSDLWPFQSRYVRNKKIHNQSRLWPSFDLQEQRVQRSQRKRKRRYVQSDRPTRRGGALVSGVLVGGEGGEGRGRRGQRQGAGLGTDASCGGGVRRRLRDAEGGRQALLEILLLHKLSLSVEAPPSPEGVAAAPVGGIRYPGNKKLLRGSVGLRPSWGATEVNGCRGHDNGSLFRGT